MEGTSKYLGTDIVTRLRDTQFGGRSLCRDAADEIERLREELETMRSKYRDSE